MDSNTTVKEMVEAIEDKKLKIVDLCDEFKFSDRTIQKKIKKLGFEWDSKAGKYDFNGTDRSVFSKAISEVFKNNIRNASPSNVKKEVEKEIKTAREEVASSVQVDNNKAVKRNVRTNIKATPETNVKKDSNNTSNKEVNNESNKTSRKTVNKASNRTVNKAVTKDSDNIDRLLAGKKAKKEYRGFYLDSDVASVIDSVNSGIKSELVNECLRKVFKEKGLI